MFEDARGVIQASDAELLRGLRDMHILIVNGKYISTTSWQLAHTVTGELRPIAPGYLKSILEMILNLLVSHSLSHAATSVEVLSSALADVHEVPRTVSTQVMGWFGEIRQGIWKMDVASVVREVGLNILRPFKVWAPLLSVQWSDFSRAGQSNCRGRTLGDLEICRR